MTTWIIAFSVGVPVALVIGLIVGFMWSSRMYKKQLKENPPISEKQIRMMYSSMGKKPSETQVRQIMKSIKDQGK
jgi:uncharacterized protein